VRENFGVKKVETLSKYSEKSAHKLIFPKTKKISQIFQIIGTLVFLCPIATSSPQILNLLHLHIKLSLYVYRAELAWTLRFDC
jgi:hypothetical protein